MLCQDMWGGVPPGDVRRGDMPRLAAPWGDVPLGDILWCGGGDRRRGVHPLPVGGGGPLKRGRKEWIRIGMSPSISALHVTTPPRHWLDNAGGHPHGHQVCTLVCTDVHTNIIIRCTHT